MKFDLDQSIDLSEFNSFVRIRIYNTLKNCNIETYRDLLNYDISKLLEIECFGSKSFIELYRSLLKKGISLQLTDKGSKELLDEYSRINKETNNKLKTYSKILSDCYNSIIFEIEHIYKKESLLLNEVENLESQHKRVDFLKKLLFKIIDILEEKDD